MSDPRYDALERRVSMLEALVLELQRKNSVLAVDVRQPVPLPQIGPPDPAWTPIFHRNQRPDSLVKPCGEVAHYLTQPPMEGVNATREVMRIWSPSERCWRVPDIGDIPRCASCEAPVDPFSNADLDYLSVMLPPLVGAAPTLPRSRRTRKRSGERSTEAGPPTSDPGVLSPDALGLSAAPLIASTYPFQTADQDAATLHALAQQLWKDRGRP